MSNYNKEYYQRRKEFFKEHNATYHKKHADELKLRRRMKPWKNAVNSARWRSAKRGIEFDLTQAWAKERYTGFCEITGIPFEMGEGGIKPRSPSLDRIDSSKGYVKGNCRFILHCINFMKFTGTDQELYDVCVAVVESKNRLSL